MSEFLDELAEKESTNNPTAINQYGYLGLWQMGESALVDSGFVINDGQMNNNYQDYTWSPAANVLGITTYTDFLNNSSAQLTAIQKYHAKLEKYLRNNGAWDFIGQTVDGVVVTTSGLLAAAHLVGAKAVGQWLSSGGNPPADGNGVTAGNFLKRFNNLEFSTDKILVDSDGNTFEVHKEFNADGSLKSETLTDRKANGDYSSETYDKDGNLLSTDNTIVDPIFQTVV